MKESNIIHLFETAALQHKEAFAFIEKEEQTTYAELLKEVQQAAAGFTKTGIGKGDTVLVFVPMTTRLYVVVLALLYVGAVPVFLDEWVSLQRLQACLQTVPCKAIVAARKLLFISWFIGSLRRLKKITPGNLSGKAILPQAAEVSASDTALVTFTTGSTGTPKAANRTHHFLQAQYNALYPLLDNNYAVTLTLLPVVILLNLCLGKTNVLPAGKVQPFNPKAVWQLLQLVQTHSIQSIIASPAITVALAKARILQPGADTVQQVITGGGPLFPEGAIAITKAFPCAAATVVYGSTEAEPISTLSMDALAGSSVELIAKKGLAVGSIHSDVAVAIVPFTTNALPGMSIAAFEKLQLPPGTSGELLVSGPHVLQQYLNNEAAQQQNKFRVAGHLWHRTGDEARLDENGNLYFLGRCKEVILWKGKKLYPLLFTWLLKQQVTVGEAALLLHHNQLLLVLEKKDKHLATPVNAYLKKALPEAVITWIKNISKDKRHQTKIDYERLQQLL